MFSNVADESRRLEGQRANAEQLVGELRSLSEEQRRLVIKNSSRYRNWGLAEQLLAECRSGWSDDPRTSESLALLALDVIESMDDHAGFRKKLLSDLGAEAWSYVGNCRRISSDLHGAMEAFAAADQHLQSGTGDALEHARLWDLKASFFAVTREFDRADEALKRAIHGYRVTGDPHLEGRALLKRAAHLRDRGELKDAISVVDKASRLIDGGREPYLEFLVLWKKLVYLTDLGATREASLLLPEVRAMARERAPRLERLRLLWTEGILKKKLGQVEIAEEALKQVREGYVAAEIAFDVALVSLDLASLYLESGRTDEVRSLAIETVPLLAARGIQREVLVAWSLFQKAAEQQSATLSLVCEVAVEIRRIQQRLSSSETIS